MLHSWNRFQNSSGWCRIPVKAVILALTVFVVCFPYPHLFVRHVSRWQRPNDLIEPDATALKSWLAELQPLLVDKKAGSEALKVVEKYVYDNLPYAWDWDTWGVADYIPTVDEALNAGHEDCDGRAVVSASILRNLGYKAELVTDMTHVWVKTDKGETMSPGKMRKLAESTDTGLKINWNALLNIPRSFEYGVAVFPLGRELIVLAMITLLAWRPGMRWTFSTVALVLMLDGLFIMRLACQNPWRAPSELSWVGVANLVAGIVLLYRHSHRTRRRRTAESID